MHTPGPDSTWSREMSDIRSVCRTAQLSLEQRMKLVLTRVSAIGLMLGLVNSSAGCGGDDTVAGAGGDASDASTSSSAASSTASSSSASADGDGGTGGQGASGGQGVE